MVYLFNGILSCTKGHFVTDVSKTHVGPIFKAISAWCFDLSFQIEGIDNSVAGSKLVGQNVKSLSIPTTVYSVGLLQWFLLTTNLELLKTYSASWSVLAGWTTEHQKPLEWRIPYKWGWITVESEESSHVVTRTPQSATVASVIGKHIFHSIEKTPTDQSFMTAIDGGRVAVYRNLWWVLKCFRLDGKYYGSLLQTVRRYKS